jgi:hypothetical protein
LPAQHYACRCVAFNFALSSSNRANFRLNSSRSPLLITASHMSDLRLFTASANAGQTTTQGQPHRQIYGSVHCPCAILPVLQPVDYFFEHGRPPFLQILGDAIPPSPDHPATWHKAAVKSPTPTPNKIPKVTQYQGIIALSPCANRPDIWIWTALSISSF